MTRTFRGDHPHVDTLRGANLAKVNIKSVRKRQRVALFEVGLDVAFVHTGLFGVGQEHHNYVGLFTRVRDSQHPQTRGLGFTPRT